jgi:hypothetical protein
MPSSAQKDPRQNITPLPGHFAFRRDKLQGNRMKSVLNSLLSNCYSLLGVALLLLLPGLAQAEQHFLANVPAGTSIYPAIATIGVRVPTIYDPVAKEFNFSQGTVDYVFQVTGDIQIWRSGPLDNYNDPITGAPVGAAADGLNTLRLEMVNLSNVQVSASSPPGSTISNIKIGDGTTGGTNSGPFFSTGGAAEIGPNGELANAFLNLFLEATVTQPQIPVPAALQGILGPTTPIGPLHNNTVMHLEAQIGEFAPDGIHFLLTNGPIGAFAPTSNAFVQALALLPAPFNRPVAEMQFAQFISADIQIVPEPSSVVFGLMAVGAFGTLAWRRRRAIFAA